MRGRGRCCGKVLQSTVIILSRAKQYSDWDLFIFLKYMYAKWNYWTNDFTLHTNIYTGIISKYISVPETALSYFVSTKWWNFIFQQPFIKEMFCISNIRILWISEFVWQSLQSYEIRPQNRIWWIPSHEVRRYWARLHYNLLKRHFSGHNEYDTQQSY